MIRRRPPAPAPLRTALTIGLALVAAGCASYRVCAPGGGATAPGTPAAPEWRDAATDLDHVKLRQLRTTFLEGLRQARAGGFGTQIAAEGRLFDPDYARDGLDLEPGVYRCRRFSLGSTAPARPAFVAEPERPCTVARDEPLLRFAEQGPPRRLSGRLYPDTPARMVLLGTVMLADESTALHYGRDPDRDRVGELSRLDAARWRLAIPAPGWSTVVEVIDVRRADR